MHCVENIEEITSMLKLMQLQEKQKPAKPPDKVMLMKSDLPIEINALQE
jgi:hypothetical protein